jgi:hypothetical protein
MNARVVNSIAIAALVSSVAWLTLALAQSVEPLSIEWTLVKTEKHLEREALITVTNAQGQPVSGASIEVKVDMPSMPMMHKVPKALAEPAGEPGRYKTRFTLEMAGEWVAQLEVKNPVRTKVIKRFNVN